MDGGERANRYLKCIIGAKTQRVITKVFADVLLHV